MNIADLRASRCPPSRDRIIRCSRRGSEPRSYGRGWCDPRRHGSKNPPVVGPTRRSRCWTTTLSEWFTQRRAAQSREFSARLERSSENAFVGTCARSRRQHRRQRNRPSPFVGRRPREHQPTHRESRPARARWRPSSALVAGHRRVDVLRPRLDPTGQVVEVREAFLQEVLRGGSAARAVVAVERERRVLRHRLDLRHRRIVE